MKTPKRTSLVLIFYALVFGVISLGYSLSGAENPQLAGELKMWHKLTLSFTGPEESEGGRRFSNYRLSPFRDYRLNVSFRHAMSGRLFTVPGYFAADGDAVETGATNGTIWRVHFAPGAEGTWLWNASFRRGRNIAVADDDVESEPVAFDGANGSFVVAATDKTGADFRGKGRLQYVGERYLRFAGTGERFLKGGADSPENFLGYFEFDGTESRKAGQAQRSGEAAPTKLHRFEPHAGDWRAGDPTWRNGRGKNIIGALNYLSSQGMNSVYFLTMNVEGDGDDVWPWTQFNEYFRFDCSKLDQWEIVFHHMTQLGLMLHVITQETENGDLLDSGELGLQRKLYYRELIARFAHHPALVWNLGEENVNTDRQRKAYAAWIHQHDPYQHPIVVHTHPPAKEQIYTPLLGFEHLEGPSLQIGNQKETHAETIKWIDRSTKAGRPWFVCLDEIGPADVGVKPDADDPDHFEVRWQSLWGNLMAGGAGVEWYFGYKHAHNDLNCEDWRSRANLWNQTRIALEFFHRYLPFGGMQAADELTSAPDDYCFAKRGEIYAIYLPKGGPGELDLGTTEKTHAVKWLNPRHGGDLLSGSVQEVQGPGKASLGNPPGETDKDWVVLVK